MNDPIPYFAVLTTFIMILILLFVFETHQKCPIATVQVRNTAIQFKRSNGNSY